MRNKCKQIKTRKKITKSRSTEWYKRAEFRVKCTDLILAFYRQITKYSVKNVENHHFSRCFVVRCKFIEL